MNDFIYRATLLYDKDNLPPAEDLKALKSMLEAAGAVVQFQDKKEYLAQGRLPDCDCQLLQCACLEARKHKKRCRYRVALTCAISIECHKHGYDVCPECDPCSCRVLPVEK